MKSLRVGVVVAASVLYAGLSIGADMKVPPTLTLTADGSVHIETDDARLSAVFYETLDGEMLEPLNTEAKSPKDFTLPVSYASPLRREVAEGRITLRAKGKNAASEIRYWADLIAHSKQRFAAEGMLLRLKADVFKSLSWTVDDAAPISFPEEPSAVKLADGSGKVFEVRFPSGRTWSISFAAPVAYSVLDRRALNIPDFQIRFFTAKSSVLTEGKGCGSVCTIRPSAGAPILKERGTLIISAEHDWTPLTVAKGIRPGSALDFSRNPFRRTPAGVDGKLLVGEDSSFVFARRKTKPVRFFGCLSRVDPFLGKPAQEAAVKRLSSCGYNSVRIGAAESRLLAVTSRGIEIEPNASTKHDQFLALASREGLSVFLGLMGEKTWRWEDLGITLPASEPEALLSISFVRALLPFSAPARQLWKDRIELLYGRKAKISGRRLSENPAVPLVMPMASINYALHWRVLRHLPIVQKAYGEWLAAKRAEKPSFMEGKTCEEKDLPIMNFHDARAAAVRTFCAEQRKAIYTFERSVVSRLRSSALLAAGDFTCSSLVIERPQLLDVKTPGLFRMRNTNPLAGSRPFLKAVENDRVDAKPHCLISWGFGAPTEYRSLAGLLVGAWAGRQGFSGVWRAGEPVSPLAAATERAVYALYARGDMTKDAGEDALRIKDGALTVVTPRTVGGYAPKSDGLIQAGELSVQLANSPATVWVSSLTDEPIKTSRRLLLTHLTDMLPEGTVFTDTSRTCQLKEGTGTMLVRNGEAKISLAIEKRSSFKVYQLGTDGLRLGRVPTTVVGDKLVFTASVSGSSSAQYLYELVRD